MKEEQLQRSRKSKTKVQARKQNQHQKMITLLAKVLMNKEQLLPKNSVNDVIKFFNLYSLQDYNVGKKYKVDFALIGIIEENGELTSFGEKLTHLNDSEKKRFIKEQATNLPKIKKIQETISSLSEVTAKDLVEVMPLNFFSDGGNSSKVYVATKVLTWLR